MRYLLSSLLLVIVVAANAQEVKSFTLVEAQQYAIQSNKSLKRSQIDIEKADIRIDNTASVGYPQVNGSAAYTWYPAIPVSLIPGEIFGGTPGSKLPVQFGTEHNYAMDLSVRQMVFNGSYIYGLRASKIYKQLVRKQVDQTLVELQSTVATAYLTALAAQESYDVIKQNIKTLERIRFETNELYKNGFAEQLDVDRIDLSLANTRTAIVNAQRQQELALNLLKFQMGYDLKKEIGLKDNLDLFVNEELSNYYSSVSRFNRIELDVIQKQIELNKMNVKLQKSFYLPTLNAFGTYQVSAQRNTFDFTHTQEPWFRTAFIGLQLDVPIFDGFKRKSDVADAKADLRRLELGREILLEQIDLEIEQSKTSYKNSYEQWQNQKSNLALAENIYNTTLIKYKEGIGSSLEVTNAETALFDTQRAYVSAIYELLIDKTDLDKALGKYTEFK